MKNFIGIAAAAVFTLALVPQVSAQTAVAGAQAGAQSASQSGSISASQGGNVTITSPGRVQTEYSGSYELKNAPAVSAPAVFGGGHPCLAGRSGGISVIGGGATYGQGDGEPACMAWVMGQPEVALRIMMRINPAFCEAMNNVGY